MFLEQKTFFFLTAPASRVRGVRSPYEYYYYYLWIIHIIIIINGVCTPFSVIHGYGSNTDQPWINVDQRGSKWSNCLDTLDRQAIPHGLTALQCENRFHFRIAKQPFESVQPVVKLSRTGIKKAPSGFPEGAWFVRTGYRLLVSELVYSTGFHAGLDL